MTTPRQRPWNQSKGRRSTGSRALRRYLIVCEDEKSSRFYFDVLKPSSDYVEVECIGTGINTDTLMKEAIRLKQEAESLGAPYVTVWCVFDRDEHPAERYARTFDLARTNGIQAIWSNECFELWYLLHFEYRNTAVPRADFPGLIRDRMKIGKDYEKGDKTIAEWFAHPDREAQQKAAIKYARKLLSLHNSKAHLENPTTMVHEVVDTLNKLREAVND